MSPGESRARVCGWVPSAGQVSLSVSVGWGDTAFYATRLRSRQRPRRRRTRWRPRRGWSCWLPSGRRNRRGKKLWMGRGRRDRGEASVARGKPAHGSTERHVRRINVPLSGHLRRVAVGKEGQKRERRGSGRGKLSLRVIGTRATSATTYDLLIGNHPLGLERVRVPAR